MSGINRAALSWLNRAEKEQADHDARFVFLWIAFNSAYANEIHDRQKFSEKRLLLHLLHRLIDSDKERLLYNAVWHHFPESIRLLIGNRHVFQPFWDYQNGRISEGDQVVHGGSTWNSSVNRSQVSYGANILAFVVPIVILLMMEHPEKYWGDPCYPVVEP